MIAPRPRLTDLHFAGLLREGSGCEEESEQSG
jgi:hypothetical protein